MSVRNLEKLFNPRSVALIGASPRPGSVGAVISRNLRRAGFAGELMLVNPHHPTIDGLIVHPSIASFPRAPDLAVIATPAETVPSLIGELGERGTRAAVIITAGFAELGERGHSLQQAIPGAARGTRTADRGKKVPWKTAIYLMSAELFSPEREHAVRHRGRLRVRCSHR